MWTLRILFIATAFSCAVASADVTITVTTVADEDGVGSACSLREAIKAVNTHAPWGGCPAGSRNSDNTIKLSASTYVLASELVVTAPVTIEGVATERPDDINPYTGTVPNRVRPTTVIDADHNGRAINASGEILLKDLIIRNGLATENGGAIYTSANLTLDNVSISDSETGGDGGAVFLASKIDSTSAGLSMTDAMFLRNVAAGTGGAVSMTCDGALGAEAQHIVGVLRALFRENEANAGAGAFRICGNSAVTMDATTFDGNVSTSGKAAVTYESATAKGTISLSYLTAVRHDGFVLRIVGIDSALISNSFFAFNNAANCDAASAVTKTTAGDYNVLSDSSCSALMRPPGSNNVVNAALAPESQLGTQLTAFGNHGGLVDGYLPLRVPATVLIDKGQISTQCASLVDQRNLPRKSGSACDIGAFERLVPTANDDEAESTPKTNRLAVIDVWANDTFGESDTGPYTFDDIEIDPATPGCSKRPEYPDKLVADNNGNIATPVVTCRYRVVDSNPTAADARSGYATVKAVIKNISPMAVADTYVRPMGQQSITFNPLDNDDDDGDGIYGQTANKWYADYPIYIDPAAAPQLGTIVSESGPCADSVVTNPRICYRPPLVYMAKNNQSPFVDRFAYSVYDKDLGVSNTVVITVKTNESDDDSSGGTTAPGLLGLVLLIGLRRLRRL